MLNESLPSISLLCDLYICWSRPGVYPVVCKLDSRCVELPSEQCFVRVVTLALS